MMQYKTVLLKIVSFLTTKHPDVVIAVILRENVGIISGNYKETVTDIINFLCKEHPTAVIDFIQTIGPEIIEQYFDKIAEKPAETTK